jgi:hypothetical protein
MPTTSHPLPPHHEPVATPPARLTLRPDGTSGALPAGAWWPRSRDLPAELPALTEALTPLWGRITRIAVNPRYWPVLPRKLPAGGDTIRIGWFTPDIAPHTLLLLSGTTRWTLLIVPPETDATSAARLMTTTAAGDPTGQPLRPAA